MKKITTLLFAVLASTTLWAWATNQLVSGICYYVPYNTATASVTNSWRGEYSSSSTTVVYSGDIYVPSKVTITGNYDYHYSVYEKVSCTVVIVNSTAFSNCPNLTSVTLPSSITKIDGAAFNGSKQLTAINIDENNAAYSSEDGILYNKNKTTLVKIPEGKQGTYVIPNTVTALGSSALKGCNMTIKVDPKNPSFSIKDGVIYNKDCTKILYVPQSIKGAYTIPNTVTAIDSYAFAGCTGLTEITIPNSVTRIGNNAFGGCSGLMKINIPNSVTSIEKEAFYNCLSLTSITIPNSVTNIGEYAFCNCAGLTSITIPNSVTKIQQHAFENCSNLTSVSLPNSIIGINGYAFRGCTSLSSIIIPNTVTYIGEWAFNNCPSLTSITIPNSVTAIYNNAFTGCSKLTSIIIPNGVQKINSGTFTSCPNLTSVILPPSVTSIDKFAFSNPCQEQLVVYTASSAKMPKHVKKVVKVSPDKMKYYEPFSSFAKTYVENGINEWQKKGEFERTNEWKERVNEQSRQQKINELLAEAEQEYNAFNAKRNKVDMQLGKYDADNEVFSVTDQKFGVAYLAVPYEEAPKFKETWKSKKINYQLRIIDDKLKLAYLSVLMPDGKEYTYRNTDAVNYNLAEAEYDFEPIDLDAAINAAQDSKNTKEVRKKSAVDTNIPETSGANPNTFVVIFANEDYKNVVKVPFAKNDGAIFQKYCQKTFGIPVTNIHYVENASFNDLRIQLAWLKDVCDAYEGNASVIVYYAGHGIPDEETKSAYLLPVDGDGRYVQSAFKIDEFYQKLGAMKAKTITVFMDACFSGSKREQGMLASARGVALKTKSGVPQGNMVVFSAAQGDETAYPNTDEQHGIFTYYLLKKLQETKGDVMLKDLGDYITTNVRQQSIVKNGKPQTPCVTPSASIGTEWQSWKLR